MRHFLITHETTLAEYLAFLRMFTDTAEDNKPETRKWAGTFAQQALAIIGQWRALELLNATQLRADLDAAFVQGFFDLWNQQEKWLFAEKSPLNSLNILKEWESLRYFRLWAGIDAHEPADMTANERNLVSNVLKSRLAEAWKNESCGELLQHRIARTLNARCLLAYKRQEDFAKLYLEIKKNLDTQWSEGTLPDTINDFLSARCQKISEILEGDIEDIEAVNQECLRILIHLWTRPHRQADVTSLNIQVSGRIIKEIQNEPNLSEGVVLALDEIASTIIQVFVSETENQNSRERFLKEALDEIFNSDKKEELQDHFCNMMQTLRVEACRDQQKAEIWKHFLKIKIRGFLILRNSMEPEARAWLEKHDLPELLELTRSCLNLKIPSLRALIQDQFTTQDFNEEPGEKYLDTLLTSLERKDLNPLALSSSETLTVLPAKFQSALKKRVETLTEKISQIKASPFQYKIRYLTALRSGVERLQKECLEFIDNYPQRNFESPEFHTFFKDIEDHWDFLPRSLKAWFLKCSEPNGPAGLAYFSEWINYSLYQVLQTSTTNSFVPALISMLISKELNTNLSNILIKKAQTYCLKKQALLTTRTLQEKLFDWLSQGWKSKDLAPVITESLGQRFLELMKNRSSKTKITNSETSELRNQAVLVLLKDFNEQNASDSELYRALSELFEPLLFDYLNDEANAEILRACLHEFFAQLGPDENLATHLAKDPEAMEALKASFMAHFYSPEAIEIAKPILKVRAIAHLEKNLSNEDQSPAKEWLEFNLPCLNQAWQIPKCSEEGYFDTVNALPLGTLEAYFPDLRKINQDLAELEVLSQTPIEKVQELKLKVFEHAAFEDLLAFVARFPNLKALNLSEMELTLEEVKALYRAAGSPKTLIYRNAPCPTKEYETFSVEDFQGLENLDLSGSAFKAISICQSSLVSLNLESCAELSNLSLKTPGLRVLNLNKCTALTYSELCKISEQAKITSAFGLPQINADLLVQAYPLLKNNKEVYRYIENSLSSTLMESLGLEPSAFSNPKPLDEESQLQNIYKFFLTHLPGLAEKTLGNKYITFELCFFKTHEEIENFNRTPLSDPAFAYDLAIWLNHPFMLMYSAVKGEEAKIRCEKIYELIIHYILADCAMNKNSRLAQKLVPLLGPREKFTASLAALCKNAQFPPLLLPLLDFADVNDPDIKKTLLASPTTGAAFLLKADTLEEETLREIYCIFTAKELRDYKGCLLKQHAAVVSAGALKFPSLMTMLKEDPETNFEALFEAGKVDNSIFDFLINTYMKLEDTKKSNFLKKMASVDNPPKCFVGLFWEILHAEHPETDLQKIAFMGIPTRQFNEKTGYLQRLCTRFFETNFYYSNDDILKKLGELDIFPSNIIPQFFKVSFSLSAIVNYLSCLDSCNVFALDEIADHIDSFWKHTEAMPAIHEGICFELVKFAVRLFCKLQPGYITLGVTQIGHPYKEWCDRIDRLILNALTKDTRSYLKPFYKEKIARIIEAELPPNAPRYKKYVSQTSSSASSKAKAPSTAVPAPVMRLEVAVASSDLLFPENTLACLYAFGVCQARKHLRRNSVPPQINYSGHDRLRSIFYGLDYYTNFAPPMEDRPLNRERLLSWMQNHFRFSNVLIVNGQSSSSDQLSALLSVKVKKVNGMCLAQSPIIWLGAENPVENAFLILPTDKTPGPCFLFSREGQKEGTEKIKEYFDVAPFDISCRNLKASEFGWMFMLVAFRILDWSSTQTSFNNSEALEFKPEWLDVLRYFFHDLAEKPEEVHVPAAERPFFSAENIENNNNALENMEFSPQTNLEQNNLG